MSRYVSWNDIVLRYPSLEKIGGAAEVGSAWVDYAEAQIDGLLSPEYSTPFSNNNLTVKDLTTELLYIRMGNLKLSEAKDMRKDFMERIKRLKNGSESMVDDSGTIIGMVGDTIYSSTANYHPVFDMGNDINFVVDSAQIENSDNAKI